MTQKVIFMHVPDATREYMDNLINNLKDNMNTEEYLFIASDKEIKCIDKDELLRVLQQ